MLRSSLPLRPSVLGLLTCLVAMTLTGCSHDRDHRREGREPTDHGVQHFERRTEHAHAPGQPSPGGSPGHESPQPDWQTDPGHEAQRSGRAQHEARDRGRDPESVLHRLEIGREAAREIGDREAAESMQRAVERTRHGEARRGDQHEPRHEGQDRLEQLERSVEALRREVEALRGDRKNRSAI